MKIQSLLPLCLTALACFLPAGAATLNVAANATASGSLYSYSYNFSITGTGLSVDNLFLGSDDLSPLNVAFTFDGATTSNWSWLGNDTPQNYLQFFSSNGGTLAAGDTLSVTFLSAFAPGSSHFAEGLNSATGATSNVVTGVLAPTAASAVPEPGSFAMFFVSIPIAAAVMMIRKRLVVQ